MEETIFDKNLIFLNHRRTIKFLWVGIFFSGIPKPSIYDLWEQFGNILNHGDLIYSTTFKIKFIYLSVFWLGLIGVTLFIPMEAYFYWKRQELKIFVKLKKLSNECLDLAFGGIFWAFIMVLLGYFGVIKPISF